MSTALHRHYPEDRFDDREESPRWARRRWWLFALLALVALIWWLPAIAAHSPLLNWGVGMATGDLNGKVTIGSASLGWFSPPVLRQIELRDQQGMTVAVLPEVQGDQTLAALLSHPSQLGRFQLREPRLEVTIDDQSSNLEQVLAKYLGSKEESAPRELALEIIDGRIGLRDTVRREAWELEKLQLTLVMSGSGAPMELKGAGIMSAQSGPGQFSFEIRLPSTAKPAPAGSDSAAGGQLSIHADSIPLAMFRAGLSRVLPVSRLSGRLAGRVKCTWDATGLQAQGQGGLDALVLAAPVLGSDLLQLNHVALQADASWQDPQLQIKQASLTTDVGELQMGGALRLGSITGDSILQVLRQQQYELSGRLDLARLASMLPNTLRIQQQAQIRSGQIQVALASRPDRQGTLWQARLEGSDLKAVRQGREFQWPQPVLISLTAREGSQGLAVEQFKCESSFLALEAAGTMENMAASVRFDLNQLTSQLEQLLDMGRLRLAGEGWGHLNWRRPAAPRFEADLELQARNFRLAIPGYPPWEEENLVTLLSAAGQSDLARDHSLQTATLRVTTTTDVLEVKLTQPVKSLTADSSYPLEVQMQGRLESWPRRLRNWIALDDWRPAGTFRLAGRLTAGTASAVVDDLRCALDQFALSGPWLELQEPSVQLALAGRWDRTPGRIALGQGALQCSALAVQVDDLLLDLAGDQGAGFSGKLKCRGDLARLQTWFGKQAPSPWRLSGVLGGEATVQRSSAVSKGQIVATIDNLTLAHADGRQFGEPHIRAETQGEYRPGQGTIEIAQLKLESHSLSGGGKGKISNLSAQPRTDFSMDLQYDLERICHLLRPYLGQAIHFTGQGTAPVSLRGPLSLAQCEGSAAVRWASGYVQGFRLGPATANAKLAAGVLQIDPLSLEVNEGRVELTPAVRLTPEPTQLTIAPGTLVQQVRIEPAMCDSLLKYVSPAFAGVTAAEGKFSVQLDRCRIPIDNPERGELAGRLVVHSVQIGPGPLIQEMATLLGYTSPAKLSQESTIPFELRGGRIHHRGMELVFPELTVRTSGSVGLDQTLDLVVEMPIPEKWLGDNTLGTAMRGQTIQMPLAGTLYRPTLDRRELDNVARRVIGNTTRNLLEDALNKQLNRLLPVQR